MRRVLAVASIIAAWTAGCQLISGVNDLEVVDESSGGSAGSAGSGGSAGSSGSAGSGGSLAAGGSAGSGGSTGTSTGGSQATGGSAGETNTTASGGTGGDCTDQPGWDCDVVSSCGCISSQNCSYDVDTNQANCIAAGDTEPYHVCDVNVDCPRGYGCIGGICKKHCGAADDCGWDNASCLEVYDGDTPIDGFGYCSEECNPIEPTVPPEGGVACDEQSTCYAYGDEDGNLAHTTCVATTGDGVQGDPCDDGEGNPDPYTCAPGYFCNTINLTCRRYCEVGDEAGCEEGGACISFNPAAYLGDLELGSCFTCDTGDFDCSVYPECGCNTGESCKITEFVMGATECLPEGTVPAWGECASIGDCSSEGGACVGGFCLPFCEEPGGNSCAIGDCFQAVNTATSEPIPGAFYCDAPCEPVLADRASADNVRPCPEDHMCLPVLDEPADLGTGAFCTLSAGGAEGSVCDRNDQCADGLGCLNSQCTPYCRTSADCTDLYPNCVNLNETLYAGPGDQVRQCYE